MPRRPKGPNYYQSRHAYFAQINRQQIKLAGPVCESCERLEAQRKEPRCKGCRKVKEDAWKEYHARMSLSAADSAGANNTVRTVFEAHLNYVQDNLAPGTYTNKLQYLRSFSSRWGHLKVREVKKYHLEEWVSDMATRALSSLV